MSKEYVYGDTGVLTMVVTSLRGTRKDPRNKGNNRSRGLNRRIIIGRKRLHDGRKVAFQGEVALALWPQIYEYLADGLVSVQLIGDPLTWMSYAASMKEYPADILEQIKGTPVEPETVESGTVESGTEEQAAEDESEGVSEEAIAEIRKEAEAAAPDAPPEAELDEDAAEAALEALASSSEQAQPLPTEETVQDAFVEAGTIIGEEAKPKATTRRKSTSASKTKKTSGRRKKTSS